MRRILVALALVATSVFLASPAVATTSGWSQSASSTDDRPSTSEEETSSTEEESPSTDDEQSSESESSSPLRRLADELDNDDVGTLAKNPNKVKKITICHRRNADDNQYGPKAITVSVNSIIKKKGHDSHNGPIWNPTLKDMKEKWGDIIPAFSYEKKGQTFDYPGQNVGPEHPEGDVILANDCQIPGDEPEEPVCEDDPEEAAAGANLISAQAECDEDEDEEGDEDGDEDADTDPKEAAALPDTGGPALWPLFTGGLLSVLGMLMLGNRGRLASLFGRGTA